MKADMRTPEGRLAARIAGRRIEAGLTQDELAAAVSTKIEGFNRNKLAQVERGTRRLLFSEAVAIADRIDVPVELLAEVIR